MFKLIFLTTLLYSIISGNIEQGGTDSNESIPIKVERQEKPLRPRTPDYGTEISAYYQNGVIYLQFNEDIGCMDVEVINLSTGDLLTDDACSDSGVETIAVSSTIGSYSITLTTDNGSTYSGEYTIE